MMAHYDTLRRQKLILERMAEEPRDHIWELGEFVKGDSPAAKALRDQWNPKNAAIAAVLRNLYLNTANVVSPYVEITTYWCSRGRRGLRSENRETAKGWKREEYFMEYLEMLRQKIDRRRDK